MRVDSTNGASGSRRALYAALTVAAIFVLALFLRTYWNVDVAHTEDGFLLSAGSDPYYHKRAIDYIQENDWQTLITDPMLNYPYGAVNPNPPLFQWSVAVAGALLSPFFAAQGDLSSLEVATWWAMEWSPAIWGALTVLPVYFIGRTLFGRTTGLIAAFLFAVSPTALEHTSLGAADHDAMYGFFIPLAFYFYIRTIQAFGEGRNWVTDYRDTSDLTAGLGRLFRERRQGFAFAALTGMSIGAVALFWKGFPYLIGIIFAYAVLQFVVDHWRSKDSLGVFAATLVAMVVGLVVAMPYYVDTGLMNFISPAWYIVGALVVFGAVMVPTRDLPTILVVPVFAGVAGLLALIAFFVFPDVARSLLYATVYFKQSSLYQTIAEAQPAGFNTMTFAIGPIAFFLALGGLIALIIQTFRAPVRARLFTVVWALLGLYMAGNAVRFLFNATPVLAVLGGWATAWFLNWIDVSSLWKGRQSGSRKTRRKTVWPVAGVIALALLLVVPNVFVAVDAAIPPSKEQRYVAEGDGFMSNFVSQRFGAFGQDFLSGYWHDGLTWLAQQDTELEPENRPGFLSWWDYGHWAIYEGKHPAVADNFQNGYEYAANFLLSEDEEHAIELLAARYTDYYANGNPDAQGQALSKADYLALLEQVGVPANQTEATFDALDAYEPAPALTKEGATQLVQLIEAQTGKSIRYVAVDYRLMPIDDPNTGNIDFPSIFYAPVVLAEKEQSDYVEVLIQTGSGTLTTDQWEKRMENPYATPPTATNEFYAYKPAFFETMIYKTFVGTPVNVPQGQSYVQGNQVLQAMTFPQPGFGLEHFRLAYANDRIASINGLGILEYFNGATVTGQVLEDGEPRANTRVTVYDDAGQMLYDSFKDRLNENATADDLNIPHASAVTDENGTYQVTVPYGKVTIVARDGGAVLGRTTLDVTRQQSDEGAELQAEPIVVEDGSVEGQVYHDANGNNAYDEDTDELVSDLQVSIGNANATTGDDGTYTMASVSAGSHTVTVDSDKYEVSPMSRTARVMAGEETTHDVALTLKRATVTGQAFAGTEPLSGIALPIRPDDSVENNTAQPPTNAIVTTSGGNFTAQLVPGTYLIEGQYTDPDSNVEYVIDETFVVPEGSATVTRDFTYTRADGA